MDTTIPNSDIRWNKQVELLSLMRYSKTRLAAISCELPPNAVTSDEMESRLGPLYKRLKLPHGRLEMMTGIRERRFWDSGMKPSQCAILAGKKAIADSGVPVERIGALFHTSVSRDFLEPATANVVHNGLGLPASSLIFDISNACLGVLDGMVMLANMIELGQVSAGLVVAGEVAEPLVEGAIKKLLDDESLTRQGVKPAFASLTIGSGAVAIVLAGGDVTPDGHKLVGGVATCDTQSVDLCRSDVDQGMGDGAQPVMRTDSEELLKAGCRLAERAWADFKSELGWRNEDVARSFTHQVGVAHRRALYRAIGLDIGVDYSTVEFMGNTGSAALPGALALGVKNGAVKTGDKVALLGIGSGLNCLMLGLEW